MERCILRANLKGQWWYQDCLPFCWFWSGSWDILKIDELTEKERDFRKLFWLGGGGGEMTYLGKEGFACGTRGMGKLYRVTIRWTVSKTVLKDFPYTLRVPSTDCFKSIASQKKHIIQEWAFLNNLLFFESLFRCHET